MTRMEKTGLYASLVILLAVLCLIVFSKNGLLDYKVLRGKERAIQDQIRVIDLENQNLENEIQRLKTDMDYIKHVAKHEHDMAESDELIFKDKSARKKEIP
ncbi:septum formation initiator family protein [Desulfobacula sp.]|uniref:FtsB family cell division protein n=1 Tax=Desulfobacula sp. TaxID=2593537 RepID=UPI00261E7BF8|nr:septum formation initiator family protein [Desulfobacula sp.]